MMLDGAAAPGGASRPKTMLDTLENFQLEGLPPEDQLLPVDLDIDVGQLTPRTTRRCPRWA